MTILSKLDIPAETRQRVLPVLQARLVDAVNLAAQLKQAHWNVVGREFFQLHQLFDQSHAVVEEWVDDIAERIAALGGIADGRINIVARTSVLPEYPSQPASGEDHLRAISEALSAFGALVRKDIDAAADAGEQGTADLFTGISRASDKQLWMIEAHLA